MSNKTLRIKELKSILNEAIDLIAHKAWEVNFFYRLMKAGETAESSEEERDKNLKTLKASMDNSNKMCLKVENHIYKVSDRIFKSSKCDSEAIEFLERIDRFLQTIKCDRIKRREEIDYVYSQMELEQ